MWVLMLGNIETSFLCPRRIIGPKRNEVTVLEILAATTRIPSQTKMPA